MDELTVSIMSRVDPDAPLPPGRFGDPLQGRGTAPGRRERGRTVGRFAATRAEPPRALRGAWDTGTVAHSGGRARVRRSLHDEGFGTTPVERSTILSERIIRPRRSLIFAPGNRPEMIPKALATGADVVTVDLEDAIAPNDKTAARERTLAWFAENEDFGGVEPVVRVNCLRSVEGLADLQAIVESPRPPPAIMLPKVKSPGEVRVHEELALQAARPIRLHVIIETNEGLDACIEIAKASDLVDALLFGGVDMAAELRVEPTWNALLHAQLAGGARGGERRGGPHRRAFSRSQRHGGARARGDGLRRARLHRQGRDPPEADPDAETSASARARRPSSAPGASSPSSTTPAPASSSSTGSSSRSRC